MSAAARALGEFILGLPLSPLMAAHLHTKAQAAIAEAAEQTAALRAAIKQITEKAGGCPIDQRLCEGTYDCAQSGGELCPFSALLADAGQAGACDWKIERCPICRHDAPHVGCVTAVLETLAAERARQR